jgi:hypothetical protein
MVMGVASRITRLANGNGQKWLNVNKPHPATGLKLP